MPQPAQPPICARCNRPRREHFRVERADNVIEWVLLCPTALYHPLSVEAPPEAEGWTERTAAQKDETK